MRIEFTPEALRTPHDTDAELVVCSIWEDERPLRGVAGLIDWHLLGRLHEWVKAGHITGKRGEAVILPGRPHISVEKIVLLGCGTAELYGEAEFRLDLERAQRVVDGLRARRPIIELPLRRAPGITKERAASLLYEQVMTGSAAHDVWNLVETNGAAKILTGQIAKEELAARRL